MTRRDADRRGRSVRVSEGSEDAHGWFAPSAVRPAASACSSRLRIRIRIRRYRTLALGAPGAVSCSLLRPRGGVAVWRLRCTPRARTRLGASWELPGRSEPVYSCRGGYRSLLYTTFYPGSYMCSVNRRAPQAAACSWGPLRSYWSHVKGCILPVLTGASAPRLVGAAPDYICASSGVAPSGFVTEPAIPLRAGNCEGADETYPGRRRAGRRGYERVHESPCGRLGRAPPRRPLRADRCQSSRRAQARVGVLEYLVGAAIHLSAA